MLIFDMDGTLWDTTNVTLKAANEIAKIHNDINLINIDTVKKGMGLSKEENAKNYMPYIKQETAIKYIDEINDKTVELINKQGADIYDNVVDTIKKLSKKYKLGIVTNNNDDYAKIFMKKANLNDYFTDYIGTATYGITKADAIKIMTKRNKEDKNYYIGDIKKDMIASNNAGVDFIHAKYGFGKDLKSKLYINDISELINMFD